MKLKINWDAFGVAASVACAIHCAILPLFLSSLTLLGVNIIENKAFEYGMILLAFGIGSYSLYHGFKRHHHSWIPWILFALGIACLLLKQAIHQWQFGLLPPAVTCIIAAHYYNYKFCNKHNHAHETDCRH